MCQSFAVQCVDENFRFENVKYGKLWFYSVGRTQKTLPNIYKFLICNQVNSIIKFLPWLHFTDHQTHTISKF